MQKVFSSKFRIMLLATAALAMSCGSAMADWNITDLGTGLISAVARSINNSGDVVGSAKFSDSTPYHAALWRNGVATDLGSLHDQSEAHYISDSGLIVGEAFVDPKINNMYRQAAIFSVGNDPVNIHSTMGYNANNSVASGASNTGLILGQAYNDNVTINHAVLWRDGTAYDMNPAWSSDMLGSALRKINSSGQMVGYASPSEVGGWQRATLWDAAGNASYLHSTGWQTTSAIDINDSGKVLVWMSNGVKQSSALWDGTAGTSGLQMISNPFGWDGFTAGAINNSDQVVGYARTTVAGGDALSRAILWSNGTAIDLNTLFSDTGYYLVDAYDINDKGQLLVGANKTGFNRGATTTLILTPGAVPTPIPAALPLFGSGLAVLGFFRRRFFLV
jgi:probable HAF family extracellular repeat protein